MSRPKSNYSQITLAFCAVITLLILVIPTLSKFNDPRSPNFSIEKSNQISYQPNNEVQEVYKINDSKNDKSFFNECLQGILNSGSNSMPHCYSKLVMNKDFSIASRLISEAKERTVDSWRISLYNSKLNDLEIIERYNVDNAFGEYNDDITAIKKDGFHGVVKKDGTLIYECIFDDLDPQMFQPLIMIGENGKKGFINSVGTVIHPPRFDEVNPQYGKPFIAYRNSNGWGFMDTLGKILIEPQYDSLLYVQEDRIGVKKNGKYGFINNHNGDIEVQIIYNEVTPFQNGISTVRLYDNEFRVNQFGEKQN